MKQRRSARFRENHLADVDVAGEESGLAIGEIIFPQPPEPLVEADGVGCGQAARKRSAIREGPGIILAENALAETGTPNRSPSDFRISGDGSMPPGKT